MQYLNYNSNITAVVLRATEVANFVDMVGVTLLTPVYIAENEMTDSYLLRFTKSSISEWC